MRSIRAAGTAILLSGVATSAAAVGLDRSNQDIGILFQEGRYFELNYGYTMPDVSGEDTAAPTGAGYEDVANDFSQLALGFKTDVNDQVSFAVILDQPFGADVFYPGPSGGSLLGGTSAELDSVAVTALARYRITDRLSVYGGPRWEQMTGDITLSGLGYGDLNGYNVKLDSNSAWGYVLGAAYEIPDIALRVALTYNSSITHDFESTETIRGTPVELIDPTLSGDDTEVETPEAWNLDFQTGIAEDTLLFGSVRWAEYERVIVSPEFFGPRGGSLTDIDDNYEISLGLGRRFNDQFSGAISVGYEPEGDDDLVSPLAPTNGDRWVQVGGTYTRDAVSFTGGIRYTAVGDARPETAETLAAFEDNHAVSIGLSLGYRY